MYYAGASFTTSIVAVIVNILALQHIQILRSVAVYIAPFQNEISGAPISFVPMMPPPSQMIPPYYGTVLPTNTIVATGGATVPSGPIIYTPVKNFV